jgi:hypothetical protein
MPAGPGIGLVKRITLKRIEDTQNASSTEGESTPSIVILVFKNTKKQFPRSWADENTQYSNINLIVGNVEEAVVGGANAIRYTADGLYASENIVVAHGGYMYVITGQYLDQDSSIHRDYVALVQSVRFIPAPGQN